ncbi:MAG TPA: DUF1684 domain-containing protein [Bryobacteraceae bacterium]|jgi:uncharacterized protein (DUF1684 family)|nr:DUF1684 domain-containing protein [Bryobacteraceae bacterium]
MRAAAALLCFALLAAPDTTYRQEIRKWRAGREASLKADWGWLTVTGLFWLHEGSNTVPGIAGAFTLDRGNIRHQESGSSRMLRPDTSGSPDILRWDSRQAFVIQRGDRFGIRLKDLNSPYRRDFTGLHWFPPDPAWRITARFVAEPRQLRVPNILGQMDSLPSPGYAAFSLNGRELRLYPVLEEPGAQELFFIFRDTTSRKETYGAGRFLYTDLPSGGRIVLDFNKAYNPPCAFTPYATCPLPPPQNRLPVRIEAGEMRYGHHGQ